MKKNDSHKSLFIQKDGFSLIELMIVVVLIGLIVLGLVAFFTGGARSWITGQSQLKAQREARQAMDSMVREIREGSSIVSGSNATSINIDYLVSFSMSAVNYSLTGTTISRNSNPFIDNVLTLNFTYPDASKVHILLEVDVDDDGRPDITPVSYTHLTLPTN